MSNRNSKVVSWTSAAYAFLRAGCRNDAGTAGHAGLAANTAPQAVTSAAPAYSWRAFLRYFLRLGALGFGGPIALVGYMQRDLVDERRWIDQRDYDEGLALAQLAPGPLAAQLAIYLGWVKGRVAGAAAVSFAFIGPSFVMVLALAAFYLRYGGLPWMQGAFYGIGAAVIAIIAKGTTKLVSKTLGRDRVLWAIAVANAAVTALTGAELVSLVLAGGAVSLALRREQERSAPGKNARLAIPLFFVTGLKGPASAATLWKILWYFTTAGLLVFGSGLAIVPFLRGGVVITHGWLDERQFLDAVAVAMITPGPVVITVAFIGYLVAGMAGATLAAIGMFVPCFLLTVLPAPYFRRLAGRARIKTVVEGITAAAVGAIAGAVVVLGRRAIVDFPTAAIALSSLALLLKVKNAQEPLVIVAAGLIGVGLSWLQR